MKPFEKWGYAIFVGLIFFIVTNALAFDAVFGTMKQADLDSLSRREIIVLWVKVLAIAGTNILAYLNRSVARAGITPTIPPTTGSIS